MLRDGPALAIPYRDGETSPATRLWRKEILIPALMVTFEINVAGVIARRGYPMLSLAWCPRVPGVGGRSRGNPRPAPGGADMESLHAMRTLSQWRHTQVTRPMWFPSSRTCSACGRVNAKLKRERTWTCPTADPA